MRIETRVEISSDPAHHGVPRKALRESCLVAGLSEKQANRLELALGEAMSNVTRHCYGGACDRPIVVECLVDDREIRLVLIDHGPEVDEATLPAEPTPCDQPGGLGLHFIRQTMSEVHFEKCSGGGNRLVMIYNYADKAKELA
jgi:anti-sigma regulatory factor (Ser/Thr protein kinase)